MRKQWPTACVGLRTGKINCIAVVDVAARPFGWLQDTNGSTKQITYQIEKWIPRVPMPSPRPSAYGMRPRPASSPPALPRLATPLPRRSGTEQPATVPAVGVSFSRDLDDGIPVPEDLSPCGFGKAARR